MNTKILNITGGDVFNHYLLSKSEGEAVPFREVMMDGNTVEDIYFEEFIRVRSSELKVSAEEYRSNMAVYDALRKNGYTELHLWFGKDTFCQMNLLTLLAYLEQISYCGKVILNYIEDETFRVLEKNIAVELGSYKKLYEDILIRKQIPCETGILISEAIELYFDYHSENGRLAQTVRDHTDKTSMELLCLLLEQSSAYGLSDIQAEKLIKKYKEFR